MREIKCPKCKTLKEYSDVASLFEVDGDEFEVECYNCGNKFKVIVSIEIDFDVVGYDEGI